MKGATNIIRRRDDPVRGKCVRTALLSNKMMSDRQVPVFEKSVIRPPGIDPIKYEDDQKPIEIESKPREV